MPQVVVLAREDREKLERIERAATSEQREVLRARVILLNIHGGRRWEESNARHANRFHFHHTPIHASWANQVELGRRCCWRD